MSEHPRHPDIFDDAQAVAYLGLDAATDTPESAIRLLHRFSQDGRIHPFKWCKKHLWCRTDLDQFIARETAALAATSCQTVVAADPEPASGDPGRNGHKLAHRRDAK